MKLARFILAVAVLLLVVPVILAVAVLYGLMFGEDISAARMPRTYCPVERKEE
jgi:hypothetical protein